PRAARRAAMPPPAEFTTTISAGGSCASSDRTASAVSGGAPSASTTTAMSGPPVSPGPSCRTRISLPSGGRLWPRLKLGELRFGQFLDRRTVLGHETAGGRRLLQRGLGFRAVAEALGRESAQEVNG